MHPTSLVSDADFDDSADVDGEKHSQSKHHRGFHRIDEAGIFRQYNFFHLLMRMLCLCLALVNLLHSVAPPSSSFVSMAVSIPHWVVKSDRMSPDEDRLREDYYYEALAFSRHTTNQEFDEETMKPVKAAEAPRHAGIDPSTMKMKRWYQGHDRVGDQKALTGTDRASLTRTGTI